MAGASETRQPKCGARWEPAGQLGCRCHDPDRRALSGSSTRRGVHLPATVPADADLMEPPKTEQAPRSGSFWLADAPEKVLRGRLLLDGEDSPSLDLDGSLTPWVQERSPSNEPDGSPLRILVPSADGPEFESLVVHGELDTGKPVTLHSPLPEAVHHHPSGQLPCNASGLALWYARVPQLMGT